MLYNFQNWQRHYITHISKWQFFYYLLYGNMQVSSHTVGVEMFHFMNLMMPRESDGDMLQFLDGFSPNTSLHQ
jgi:hypothetical protein